MGARSSEWIKDEEEPGGAEGDRTPDLHTASVALSQLSYSHDRNVWYQTAAEADNCHVGAEGLPFGRVECAQHGTHEDNQLDGTNRRRGEYRGAAHSRKAGVLCRSRRGAPRPHLRRQSA